MSIRGVREALRAQPRWMLAVLLAFGIFTLPPPSALVSHRHAAGDVAHTHVGPLARTVVDGEYAATPAGSGLTRDPAPGLHQHVVHPVIAMRGPEVRAQDPTLLTTNLFLPAAPAAVAAASRPGHARAPPSLDV